LLTVGLHTRTAVARSLCVSWAFLLSLMRAKVTFLSVNYRLQQTSFSNCFKQRSLARRFAALAIHYSSLQ